jgi:putative membrane protein
MKTINYFLRGMAIACTIILFSCNNNNTDNDTSKDAKKDAEEHNDAKFDNKPEKDAQFLVDAADISLMEMNLGQLAEKNATLNDTKELGRMMNRDHKKAYDELTALAAKKTITVPTQMSDKAQKDYNDMLDKKGNDFDKKYCDMMVSGHKDAIEKFEKASKDAVDPDIQAWAVNTLPALRSHLDRAMNCQEKTKDLK